MSTTGPDVIQGYIRSFRTVPRDNGFITHATIEADRTIVTCIWRHYDKEALDLTVGQEYLIRGEQRSRADQYYMIQPHIQQLAAQEIIKPTSHSKRSRFSLKRTVASLAIFTLVFSITAYGYNVSNNNNTLNHTTTHTSESQIEEKRDNSSITPQELTTDEQEIDIDNLFSNYNSTYDQASGSYSFDYDDMSSYLSRSGYSSRSLNNTTYRSGSETWSINCSEYTNNCQAYSSSGHSASIYCSQYTNNCSTHTSDGSSYNTYCSDYTSNCSTYGSDGYSSNTYCSNYSSSCSTYNSDGGYSNTYCSSYTSYCNTYGSDGYSSSYSW